MEGEVKDTHKEKDESFTKKVDKTLSGRNWTWTLRILAFIAAGGLIAAGVVGFLDKDVTGALPYLILIYLIILGVLQLSVLFTFPAAWVKVNMKWVPFLHTYRGRGFFLILMGCLATGTCTVNIFIGIGVILIGLFHVILACCYRDNLDPNELKKQHDEDVKNKPDENELQQSSVNDAWQKQQGGAHQTEGY